LDFATVFDEGVGMRSNANCASIAHGGEGIRNYFDVVPTTGKSAEFPLHAATR